MTTAARPTWAPAKGGNEQGGTRIFGPSQKYSSRDMAAHTSLKPRFIIYAFLIFSCIFGFVTILLFRFFFSLEILLSLFIISWIYNLVDGR